LVETQAQTTMQETTKGSATVTTSELTGEVLGVEGNDLAVKLSTGEVRIFHVPPTRRFLIDGKDLSVGELQPGTTLTATVKTTTTPVTVRTKSVIRGKVWYASPPNVILTLSTGENKGYVVKEGDNVGFILRGKPATVFDLRKGQEITAEKIVEEPDTEIVTDTTVTGHAPAVAVAKESAVPPAPEPGPATAPEPARATTPAPPAPAAPESAEPKSTPAEPVPAATPTEMPPEPSTKTNPILWIALLAAAIVIILIVRARRSN